MTKSRGHRGVYTGKSIKRREDDRLLRGRGQYVDDIYLPNMSHAAFVRSPHAHARIRGISTATAESLPGVLAVLTGEDARAAGLGDLACIWEAAQRDGSPMNEVTRPILVTDRVRHVGDTLAVVVAEDRYQAMDAAEAVEVDYEPLPAVVDTARALDSGAPLVHERFGSNIVTDWDIGDEAATEAAFAKAAHVTALELTANRLAGSPVEPRACVGHYDAGTDHYSLWTTSQNPHLIRHLLAENSLKVPEHKIRVISPTVGGGFGVKIYHYPEEPAVLWVSERVGRPVRWTSTRSEALMVDTHARDHVTSCRMALDEEGRILALRVDTIASAGAYLSAFGACIPTQYYAVVLSGCYAIPAIYCRVRLVYSHTTPVDAYRGAGRPEAIYVVERLVENAARELGMDVCALRERNLIPSGRFPYETAVGTVYDSADLAGLFAKGKALADYDGLRREQERLRGEGVLMGIGVGCFFDIGGFGPSQLCAKMGGRMGSWESASLRVHPSGKATLFCGTHSHGQGHVTTYGQIAADRLGIPIEDIEVVEGDTDRIPFGLGTYASRSLTVAGPAIVKAIDRVIAKGARLAAHLLDCAEGEIDYSDGHYSVRNTNRQLSFEEVARAAYVGASYPEGFELGLEETSFFDPEEFNYPSGIHLCTVRVDPETGKVAIRDYAVIDDIGTVINPMIVEGQVHGGIAQGVGQALMEHVVYDAESGQLLTGSFMDYCMPRADDLPFIAHGFQETPCPSNPLGAKAIGECGTIGALATVANAVVDALWPLGVRHVETPITPMRVWQAIRSASG